MKEDDKNNILFLFPTTILSTQKNEFVENLLPVTKYFLAKNDSRTVDSPIRYNTTFRYSANHGLEALEEYKTFCEALETTALEYANFLGYVIPENKFKIHLFASEMYAGDCIPKHTHPNSIFSGAFYLQTPPGSSNIAFSDPKPVKNIIQHRLYKETVANMSEYSITPKPGMMLIWESWLEHQVMINDNKDDGRISLNFFIYKKGF